MSGAESNVLVLIAVTVGLGFVPFLAVTTTAFLKISVVLFLIRNALGTQNVPPNIVLYAVAIILALFIAAPLIAATYAELAAPGNDFASIEGIIAAVGRASGPLREHLFAYTTPPERQALIATTRRIWPEEAAAAASERDLIILLPAYVISELRRAFEIGFLLYLPFIAIDLIVANVLMAMGMMMVSPLVISVPFKLFLFVLVDGWDRLVGGLLLSYGR